MICYSYSARIITVLISFLLFFGSAKAQTDSVTVGSRHSFGRNTVEKIDHIFADYDRPDSPGYAIGILKDTTKSYVKGYGSANLDYEIPISGQSAFDIASVSKQFTAACIALLIMDGKLTLETPAQQFIPKLSKFQDTIRVKHLIYNTSGLTDYFKLPRPDGNSWLDFYYFDIDDAINTSLSIDSLAFSPGVRWEYSNVNYMLLAKIVEKISGEPFSKFIDERLFVPLEMHNTIVNDDITAVIKNRVTPYNPRSPEYIEAYKKEGIIIKSEGQWIQHHRNSPHYGGSGIITTVDDLMKWSRNFFTRKFGGDTFYRLMHHTEKFQHDMENQAFGLYFDTYKNRTFVAWDGATAGISSQMIRFPEKKMAIIVLSNLGTGNASQKAKEIADVLIQAGEL